MRDVILDIVKHTGGLGFITQVKVVGTDETTSVEARDEDKTVFVRASLKPLEDLKGEFGLTHLDLLQGLLNFANYKAEGASFNVKRRDRNGVSTPEEFQFRDASGAGADFRLTSADRIMEQGVMMSIKWDMSITPSKSKVQEFAQLAQLYKKHESTFSWKTVGDELHVYIGEEGSAAHRAHMVFEKGVSGTIKEGWVWPSDRVLDILKLGDGEPVSVSFTTGAIKLSMDTEFGRYDFILPGRRRA